MKEDKIPPQRDEAEQAVIGAMLLERAAIVEAMNTLQVQDFYREKYRTIYTGIKALYDRGEPVDLITLGHWLESGEQLEAIGGTMALMAAMASVPTAYGAKYYAGIVRQMATRRQLIKLGDRMMQEGYRCDEDVQTQIVNLQADLQGLTVTATGGMTMKPLWQWEQELVAELEATDARGEVDGLSTGFTPIDDVLEPMKKGDVCLVAARPGMGKSALVAQLALSVASTGIRVDVYSIEMSARSLAMRFLQAESGLNDPESIKHLRERQSNKQRIYSALSQAIARHKQYPIYLAKPKGLCARQLLQYSRGAGMVVVDYLQLMHANARHRDRYEEVGAISREVKETAMELETVVLAVSQLSRTLEDRTVKRPMLSDLRESGQIEQDADACLFLYRPGYYGPAEWKRLFKQEDLASMGIDAGDEAMTELIFAKQRNGRTGRRWAFFDMPRQTFGAVELRKREQPPLSDYTQGY